MTDQAFERHKQRHELPDPPTADEVLSQTAQQRDAVIDLGLDPTGETSIHGILSTQVRDGDRIIFPPGEYRVTEQIVIENRRNFALLGSDETTFVVDRGVTGGILQYQDCRNCGFINIDIDQTETPCSAQTGFNLAGRSIIKDVQFVGYSDPDDSGKKIAFNVQDSDGALTLRRVYATDGTEVGREGVDHNDIHKQKFDGGFWSGPPHKGTAYFIDCRSANWSDNGLYASRTNGGIVVLGGWYANSSISQVRLGHPESFVGGDVRIEIDRHTIPSPNNPSGLAFTRGIWLESGSLNNHGATIGQCRIRVGNVGSFGGCVRVSSNARWARINGPVIIASQESIQRLNIEPGSDVQISPNAVIGADDDWRGPGPDSGYGSDYGENYGDVEGEPPMVDRDLDTLKELADRKQDILNVVDRDPPSRNGDGDVDIDEIVEAVLAEIDVPDPKPGVRAVGDGYEYETIQEAIDELSDWEGSKILITEDYDEHKESFPIEIGQRKQRVILEDSRSNRAKLGRTADGAEAIIRDDSGLHRAPGTVYRDLMIDASGATYGIYAESIRWSTWYNVSIENAQRDNVYFTKGAEGWALNSHTFVGCQFDRAGRDGMRVGDGAHGISLYDVSCTSNGRRGVTFGSFASALIHGGAFQNNRREGIRAVGVWNFHINDAYFERLGDLAEDEGQIRSQLNVEGRNLVTINQCYANGGGRTDHFALVQDAATVSFYGNLGYYHEEYPLLCAENCGDVNLNAETNYNLRGRVHDPEQTVRDNIRPRNGGIIGAACAPLTELPPGAFEGDLALDPSGQLCLWRDRSWDPIIGSGQ